VNEPDRHSDRRSSRESRHGRRGHYGRHSYYGHWDRPRPRPKWWPLDEAWPPAGEFPWRKVRRRFFARFAIFIAIAFILLVLGPIVLIGQILSATGLPEPGPRFLAVVIVAVMILGLATGARGARRFAVPFGDLIEATGRVEAGDYTTRVVVPARGVREMRWLSEAFNSMAARLETDELQRRTLLADVSHELRTPLAVLRGELEAMIDGVHPMDEANLGKAVDQIGMLTQLVEDLRTLALAEAGTLALHREQTDLAILAQEAAGSFEAMAAAAGVHLAVRMPDDMPLVDLDPLRIQQVIGNLVANALRYAPAGSEVAITGAVTAIGMAVSVTDHGPGIDPELMPRIFERFAKSDSSRGSGLGLAIARRLVEAHGGSIRAEVPEAGGTVITFDLPAATAAT
jgi:two-component system sensor histidine kinase BaeS